MNQDPIMRQSCEKSDPGKRKRLCPSPGGEEVRGAETAERLKGVAEGKLSSCDADRALQGLWRQAGSISYQGRRLTPLSAPRRPHQ